MNWTKQYTFRFDFRSLALFLTIMLPNFYWFAVPAPNDILRQDSVTPMLDLAASVCQILAVAAICLLVNRNRSQTLMRRLFPATLFCCAAYYAAWFFYYRGVTNTAVILSLCLFPCAALLSHEMGCKKYPAMIPTVIFTLCHLMYGLINFIF